MRWALNSSRPAIAANLESVLEEEIAHFERTLDDRMIKNRIAAEERVARGLAPEPEQDYPTMRNASHEAILVQMRAGVKAASALASTMATSSTQFLVTIAGHFDPDHSDGIEERMSIAIDVAPSRGVLP